MPKIAKEQTFQLGPYRCVWPTLAQPRDYESDGKFRYSMKLLIPKTPEGKVAVKKIHDIIQIVVNSTSWSAEVKKKVLRTAKSVSGYERDAKVKDGDELNKKRIEDDKDPIPFFEGHYVLNLARNAKIGPPAVWDATNTRMKPEEIETKILSGFWVKVQISTRCYKVSDAGFTWTLQAVQKIREDEIFGGESPFEEVDFSKDESAVTENPFEETA